MKNINCPKCSWKPTGAALWICESKCNQVFNTFSNYGVCPKCSKRFEDTCCPRCHRWSPHIDWYGFDKLLKDELEKISNTILK